jgi:hypothetical protein
LKKKGWGWMLGGGLRCAHRRTDARSRASVCFCCGRPGGTSCGCGRPFSAGSLASAVPPLPTAAAAVAAAAAAVLAPRRRRDGV